LTPLPDKNQRSLLETLKNSNNADSEQSITKRVLKGLFWTSAGTGAEFVLHAGALLLLARLISPEEFGVVGAAMVVINFSVIFSELGIGSALVQCPRLDEKHLRTGFTISLLFGLLLTLLVLLLSPVIAAFFQMPKLKTILMVLSIVFFLQGMSIVAESLLKRDMDFRKLTAVEVSSFALGYGITGVVMAFLGYGVWALVGATLIQALVKSTLLIVIKGHRKRLLLDKKTLNELLTFGSGLTMARIFLYFANQGDNLVTGRWLGAESLGIYGRAYQMMVMPASLFGKIVDKVLFPALAKVQDSPQRLAKAFKQGMAITGLIVLPSSAVMFILAPEIISVVLGPVWQKVVVPFQILAVGMFFRTGYKVTGTLARAKGAVYNIAWRNGLYGVMVLAGSWLALPYGLSGVATAVVVALTIYFFLMTTLSLRITKLGWLTLIKAQIPAFNSMVIMVFSTWAIVSLLRDNNFSAIAILSIIAAVIFLHLIIFYRYFPLVFIGKDGVWLVSVIVDSISDFKLSRSKKNKQIHTE